jgi:hypothetical protein
VRRVLEFDWWVCYAFLDGRRSLHRFIPNVTSQRCIHTSKRR